MSAVSYHAHTVPTPAAIAFDLSFSENRIRLPIKAFSIAKTAIDELKLDVFDCHYIDFGNRKR